MIIAETGSGKSTAIEALDPATTFVINVSGKELPWRGSTKTYVEWDKKTRKGNYYETSDAQHILRLLEIISEEMPHIETVVIDDFQYISAFEFMRRVDEAGFTKFNNIGKNMFLTATKPKELRKDLLVFYLTHPETFVDAEGNRRVKAKTIGKLVDEKITLEGLFTTVLYARVKKTKDGVAYIFETRNNGENTCKSPKGMFETVEIPNDLSIVKNAIKEYNQ